MYFVRCIITFWNTKLHFIVSMYFITGLNIPLHCIKVSCGKIKYRHSRFMQKQIEAVITNDEQLNMFRSLIIKKTLT